MVVNIEDSWGFQQLFLIAHGLNRGL